MITMRAVRQGLLPGLIVAGVLAASLLVRPIGLNGFLTTVTCSYGYLGAPTVTGIAPTSGSTLGGNSVVITGCGFTGATAVHFGANAAGGMTINSDSQITATSPAGSAGTVHVDVTTPAGTSAHTTADQFTYGVQPCTGVTATVSDSGPVTTDFAGSTPTIQAVATGCTHPLFAFFILNPGGSWIMAQPYSARSTMNWDTGGPEAPGTYYYSVWVRDTTSSGTSCNSLGCNDAYKPGTAFPLTTHPCTGVTAVTDSASPQNQGTTVTITATGVGCISGKFEFWLLAPGSTTWQIVQSYSFNNSFQWFTGGNNGLYYYSVWVQDFSSQGTHSSSLGTNDAFKPGTAFMLN
jgi:hypothetical protein